MVTLMTLSLKAFEKEKISVIFCYFGLSFLQHPFKINLLTDSSSMNDRLTMILNLESALVRPRPTLKNVYIYVAFCYIMFLIVCLVKQQLLVDAYICMLAYLEKRNEQIGTIREFPQLTSTSFLVIQSL